MVDDKKPISIATIQNWHKPGEILSMQINYPRGSFGFYYCMDKIGLEVFEPVAYWRIKSLKKKREIQNFAGRPFDPLHFNNDFK